MVVSAVAAGWRTETGRRPTNEDAVLVERLPDGRELIAVADGMGGHQAGAVASQLALRSMREALVDGGTLREAFMKANETVHGAARRNPEWEGMGTTLVALLRSGAHYELANVGDSRVYRMTPSRVQQVTVDHTFVAEALAEGSMTAEEARRSRWRNALTRAVGMDPEIDVDVFGPFDATEAHVVMLCSDGCHGSVSDEFLATCLGEGGDPQEMASRLTDEAFRNGSTDNISVAVVRFSARGSRVAATSPPAAAPARRAAAPARGGGRRQPFILLAPARPPSRAARLRRLGRVALLIGLVLAAVVILLSTGLV